MSRGGTDPFVERVREATDIVEIIGAHVSLKPAGSRLAGLCPFHQEKTPSFHVNPQLQFYHCFGCGAGGDVFTFVMEHEKMSFPEALRFLAEKAGIPVPERSAHGSDRLEKIREALNVARAHYRQLLEGRAGARARAYLDNRGIAGGTRELYTLGLAPEGWDGLVRHCRSLLSERVLIEAGLALEASSGSGRVYDRFRNRIMIPIETSGGAPAGFGGRGLGDEQPKYLNSPETPVYSKGSVLFGTAQAREGTRSKGRVIVVEGYFDAILMVQEGVGGVVGTCGTALTPRQAASLRRLSDTVVLLFDGDQAGRRAALRALPVLVGEVSEVLVAFPPADLDPDDWIRRDGPAAVEDGLQKALSPLAFLQKQAVSGVMSRREAAGRAAELIAVIRDPLNRDIWLQEASARFGVGLEAFREAVGRVRPAAGQGKASARDAPARSGSRGPASTWKGLARECLRAVVAEPGQAALLASELEDAGLEEERDLRSLLEWVSRAWEEAPGERARLLSRAGGEHPGGRDLAAIAMEEGLEPQTLEVLRSEIRRRGLKRRAEDLAGRIRLAEESGDRELLSQYLVEKQEIAKAIGRITGSRGNSAVG